MASAARPCRFHDLWRDGHYRAQLCNYVVVSFNCGRGWQLAAPALSQPPCFSENCALLKTTQRNLLDFSLKVLHLIQSQAYDLHHKSSMFSTMPSFWHHWYVSWLLEKQQITTILIISRAHTVMLFLVFEYLSPSVLLLDRLFLILLHGRENSHVATEINDGQLSTWLERMILPLGNMDEEAAK